MLVTGLLLHKSIYATLPGTDISPLQGIYRQFSITNHPTSMFFFGGERFHMCNTLLNCTLYDLLNPQIGYMSFTRSARNQIYNLPLFNEKK